jgi:hypothetical protein
MLNPPYLFLGLLAGLLAGGTPLLARAGDVKLTSDTLDMVCRVEVASGPDAPNGPVETYMDIKRDWSITRSGKLCYRRASTPENCDSGMTQWNTQWKCAENKGEGTQDFSLR